MRKLTDYVGASIDGFIAGPDGSVDFFPLADDMLEFILSEYPETVPSPRAPHARHRSAEPDFDAVVMGRATYEPALREGITSPYQHLRQYVVSGSITESPSTDVHLIGGDVLAQIRQLKAEEGSGIWLAGGGRLAGAMFTEIDELVIKRYPVTCGSGTPMLSTDFSPTAFTLIGARTFDSGATVASYSRS